MSVKTNDLKKGVRILLRNGWYATIVDNARGNTRMADVEGFCREIGSVYSWDIAEALVDGKWVAVELTEKQVKDRARVRSTGF